MIRLISALLVALNFLLAAPAWAQPSAAKAKTQYIQVNGDRIAYRKLGRGNPMVMVNRLRGTLDTWDPLFLDQLAASNTVIIVDYPGVGYSAGQLPPDMAKVATFIANFSTALKLDRFIIAGWSWGGAAAQAFLTDYPERVTHAVLIGTNPPGDIKVPFQPQWLERALKPINDLADEEILFFEPASPRSLLAAKASHERIYARPDVTPKIPATPEAFQPFFMAITAFKDDKENRRSKLTQMETPILVLSGTNDTSTSVLNWYPLIGLIPRGQLIVLPESGHGPQHQYPTLATKYIKDFLMHAAD